MVKSTDFLNHSIANKDWTEIVADVNAEYDQHDEINLSRLEPLIAMPSSPDKVVPVSEVAGRATHLPSLHWFVGQSRLSRFCHGRRDCSRYSCESPCFVRRQSNVTTNPRKPSSRRTFANVNPCRCAPSSRQAATVALAWLGRHRHAPMANLVCERCTCAIFRAASGTNDVIKSAWLVPKRRQPVRGPWRNYLIHARLVFLILMWPNRPARPLLEHRDVGFATAVR